ncbi:MAG: hypothetical protein ACRDD2_09235 [Sarcina sp.]
MNSPNKIYLLNSLWNLKVYAKGVRVFQNQEETIILDNENLLLCNIKVKGEERIFLNFLDENAHCEFEMGILHFFYRGKKSKAVRKEEEVFNAAKEILLTKTIICEECLEKCFALKREKFLTLLEKLENETDIKKEIRECEVCKNKLNCLFVE